jgi:hypothetical protein
MTPGFPSIRREAVPWSKAQADGYLAAAAVGVLAGIVVAYGRMPLHLPGHKALWWIPPVLAARLLTGRRAGASVGALATIATTLSLGGRLAGGALAMPLVVLAGAILDVAVFFVQNRATEKWRVLLLLSSAAAAANLVCFVKRLWEPIGPFFSTSNIEDVSRVAVSYAVFGFIAGALGMALASAVMRICTADRRESASSPARRAR